MPDDRDRPETSETEASSHASLPAGVPGRIGHYTLKGLIASGGMGSVYRAVQEQPRRAVAIKLMRRGVTSRSALRRFEYEAQVLARLRHPSIAQVYEAGTFQEGDETVPYFAMEYVPNAKSITQYADDKKLGLRDRLDLFAKVCDAIHHGHQKGIVHRDLKPSNILVDAHGQPKVIDFGVARATDSDMATTTLQTDVGQLVGTLQYMSPEQSEADPDDIDTRSDVYTLGVVLYRLLCGQVPYTVEGVSIVEAARVIREQTPTRPSASDRTMPTDVETIVLKALEKDRDRRYQSAYGLAQDLRRYLAGEAISARPPSLSYQLRVFARRNKAVLAATGAVFAVLLVASIVSTSLYLNAERARDRAEHEKQNALAAMGFLQDIVGSADPATVGLEIKIGDILDRYGAKIGEAFPGEPLIEAAVRTSISRSYTRLDLFEKHGTAVDYQEAATEHLHSALELRRKARGGDHPETLDTMIELAELHQGYGRPREAERLLQAVLEIRVRELGPDHPDTLGAKYAMADLLIDQGRMAEAEPLVRETCSACARVFGEQDPATLEARAQLADLLHARGDLAEAEQVQRGVFESSRRVLEEDDDLAAGFRTALATSLLAQGKVVEAERLYDDRVVPSRLEVDSWFQGDADWDPGRPTLVALWESWCPYSYRAMPRVQDAHRRFEAAGLQVVGVTQVTRTADEDSVREFIADRGLTFPIGKESGSVSDDFNRSGGVPFTFVVRDGKVVWDGHPAFLSDRMLAGLLGVPDPER